MTLRDLTLRARALFAPRRVERELNEELGFHIERETQKLIDQGVDPAEARTRAHARFGPVPLAADECRDQRGTAFVDNTVRDLLYAFRTFRRAPLVAFTIASTVALGLGLVAVVFTLLNMMLFRVDQVPGVDQMFAVERPRNAEGERARFTWPQYDALRRETTVFVDAYAEMADLDSRIDGQMMAGTLVSGNFFHVLGVPAAMGRTLMPEDDRRYAGRPVMVLSHRGWTRRFGRDPGVLGRSLLVNGAPFEVIGIMPEGFRGLAVGAPDYWAPISLLGQFRPIHAGREDSVGLDIIGRLKPGMSRQTALAALAVWDAVPGSGQTPERRGANITLVPWRGTVTMSLEVMLLFGPLFFAFGLILLIACANVANLLLARAVSRQKEIGIRLSLGASRRRIVRQLLTESLLLALVSAAAGFGISRVVLEGTINAVLTSLPPDIGNVDLSVPAADWRVLLFLVGGAVVSTALFGLLPALQATRVEPVRTIRGEMMGDARPGRARSLLIGLQVGASALLLICSAVFLRSAMSSATHDSGVRTQDTMYVDMVNEPVRRAMVEAVTADPLVTQVAASRPDFLAPPRDAFVESQGRKSATTYQLVSPEYLGVLDIPIVRGRGFSPLERAPNAAVALVSETAAREIWPGGDAVGQILQLDEDMNSQTRPRDEPPLAARTFTVVGVVRDIAGFRIAPFKKVGVYLPVDAYAAETSLIVRIHGDPEVARQKLTERLTVIDPNMGQILTMRTMARMETYFLEIAFWLTLALGGLALALTLSGLFSVLSYLVEQRTKEIGVRMALGATTTNVSRMMLSQLTRPVGAGLLIGGGLAGGMATLVVATLGSSNIDEIVHVFDPVAYTGSLLCIVAACIVAASIPARRAAHIDPANTLRNE